MRNLEFKAELREPGLARTVLERAGAKRIGKARQVDTYFRVPSGRLKRRLTEGSPPEYIFYTRPDDGAPKVSVYSRMTDAQAKARFGEQEMHTRCVVAKSRELWKLGPTRIHLDEVEGLGWFLEFERELSEDEVNMDRAHGDLKRLRQQLAPTLGETISRGYADLLEAEAPEPEVSDTE